MANQKKLSKDKILYIEQNAHSMTDEQIAKEVGCAVITVAKYRKKAGINKARGNVHKKTEVQDIPALLEDMTDEEQTEYIKRDLQTSSEYENLKTSFSATELDSFLVKYIEYVKQFRSDLKATEFTQVGQLCRYEILMDRNLSGQIEASQNIEDLTKEINKEYDSGDANFPQINSLQTQVELIKTANDKRDAQYIKYQQQHAAILKDLKGTRDQRVKQVEDIKVSFFDLVKDMMEHESQKRESREIELARLAMEKEQERLSEYHEYVDGELDKPLLNEDTVSDEDS